jgi:integrase
LKAQAETGQGRRDALIMCLLLDHGLRVEEVAILTAKAFDMKAGAFTFYRPKVNNGILWHKSPKGTGKLSRQLSETSAKRAINKRAELLGHHAGIDGLSPHDGRHYTATFETRKGTPIDRLVDMFGWNNPALGFRYIEAAHIANEGTARVKQ